jgi:hypothetical protein
MRFIALASCLSILVTSSLFAVSAVAEDRVQLRDGSVYGGALVEKVPGDHLTLKLPTGEVRRFGWADLSPEAVGKSLVRLRLDSDDSQAKLYRLTEAGSLAVATSRGMAYGAYESYAPVCSVPCDTEVDPQGTYRIGGDGVTPTKAFELPALRGPDLRRVWYPRVAVTPSPAVELLVERAARDLARLNPVPLVPPAEAVRYHDPCQLGRGLGIYAAPRAVLTRILGRAPDEFIARQERATCSGAGALLPRTMQQTSRAITKSRREEHARLGGGRVVTACASSLLAFRRAGLAADDLVTWIARATPEWTGPTRTRPEQP